MRNAILKDLEWRAKKLKITENEKYTLQDGKMAAGKTEKVENLEMSTVGRGIWARKLKIAENGK